MSNVTPTPIFIFSLPRAGSTLTQRILASHSEISTATEPWILLPFLYALRKDGIFADYGHQLAANAIEDFCKELPNGRQDYLKELKGFIQRLYSGVSKPGARYFLDKTPRYNLIADEIINMFPEGKFIFLWRNPLSVVASIMETWKAGRWNLYAWKKDLLDGLAKITETYEKNRDKVLSVRYEELIDDPETQGKRIFEYLDLPFNPEVFENFTEVKLKGRMGDPVGVNKYQIISTESLEKWKNTLNTPVRKAWSHRYIKWIGKERFDIMGYDIDAIEKELDSITPTLKYTCSDIIRIIYGIFYCTFDPLPLKHLFKRLPMWGRLRPKS